MGVALFANETTERCKSSSESEKSYWSQRIAFFTSVTISRLPYEALNYNKLVHHPPIFEPIFRQNRSEPSEENEKNSKEENPRKYRELLEENTQKINTYM